MNPNKSSAVTRPDVKAAVYRDWDVTGQRAAFIAPQVAPFVEVPTRTGTYKKIERAQYLKNVDDLHDSGGFNRVKLDYTEANYSVLERALEEPVDAKAAAEVQDYFDASKVALEHILYLAMKEEEKRVAALMQDIVTLSNAAITGTKWTTKASADPVNDVMVAKRALRAAAGMEANAVIMAAETFDYMTNCDLVIAKIGSASSMDPKVVREKVAATLFGVQKLLVAGTFKVTTDEGQAISPVSIWGTDVVSVAYIPDAADITTRSGMITLHWNGDGSERDFKAEEYWDETTRQTISRCRRDVLAAWKDQTLIYNLKTVLTK